MQLTRLLSSSMQQNTLEDLLTTLLTEGEQQEIERRIHILQLLQAGETQRAVAKITGVGIATVSRGARVLAQMSPGLQELFQSDDEK